MEYAGLCDLCNYRIRVASRGASRANSAQRRRREAFVEGLLARLPILSFDAVAARIHARLSAELVANGTAVGPHDLIIAATALTKDYIVTTRDERSFPRMPGVSYQRGGKHLQKTGPAQTPLDGKIIKT